MSWHGWAWTRGAWRHVCRAPTLRECCRELDRLAPGLTNLHYALTRGAPPDWTPGLLPWEA